MTQTLNEVEKLLKEAKLSEERNLDNKKYPDVFRQQKIYDLDTVKELGLDGMKEFVKFTGGDWVKFRKALKLRDIDFNEGNQDNQEKSVMTSRPKISQNILDLCAGFTFTSTGTWIETKTSGWSTKKPSGNVVFYGYMENFNFFLSNQHQTSPYHAKHFGQLLKKLEFGWEENDDNLNQPINMLHAKSELPNRTYKDYFHKITYPPGKVACDLAVIIVDMNDGNKEDEIKTDFRNKMKKLRKKVDEIVEKSNKNDTQDEEKSENSNFLPFKTHSSLKLHEWCIAVGKQCHGMRGKNIHKAVTEIIGLNDIKDYLSIVTNLHGYPGFSGGPLFSFLELHLIGCVKSDYQGDKDRSSHFTRFSAFDDEIINFLKDPMGRGHPIEVPTIVSKQNTFVKMYEKLFRELMSRRMVCLETIETFSYESTTAKEETYRSPSPSPEPWKNNDDMDW